MLIAVNNGKPSSAKIEIFNEGTHTLGSALLLKFHLARANFEVRVNDQEELLQLQEALTKVLKSRV